METVLNLILDRTRSFPEVMRTLVSNNDILSQLAQAEENGSSVLLNGIAMLPRESAPAMVYLLRVQSEHLREGTSPIFFRMVLDVLSTLSSYGPETLLRIKGSEAGGVLHGSLCVISRKLVEIAHTNGKAAVVLNPLLKFNEQLWAHDNALTTFRSVFLQACVSAGMHSVGYKFAKATPIYRVEPVCCNRPFFDALTYFYYAGMCCIGVKKYEEALVYFMDAISFPCVQTSAVAIAALRKAQLVSLIINKAIGTFEIPPYTSQNLQRSCKQDDPVYSVFICKFEADDLNGLKTMLELPETKSVLENDGNFGLAKQAIKALLKRRMRELVGIFSRMSFSDILTFKYSDAGWSTVDVEKILLEMINSQEISAKIDQKEEIVTFLTAEYVPLSSKNDRTDDQLIATLRQKLQESMEMNKRLRLFDYDLTRSEAFLHRKIASQMQNGDGVTGLIGSDGMDVDLEDISY